MYKPHLKILVYLFVVFIIEGCATFDRLPVEKDELKVEPIGSVQSRVSHISTWRSKGKIGVNGVLRLGPGIIDGSRYSGQLDITLRDPEGKILNQKVISYNRIRRSARYSRFYFSLPGEIPRGSTLQIGGQHVNGLQQQGST